MFEVRARFTLLAALQGLLTTSGVSSGDDCPAVLNGRAKTDELRPGFQWTGSEGDEAGHRMCLLANSRKHLHHTIGDAGTGSAESAIC